MTISVLVPSYRRTSDLARCLGALRVQTHAAHEVLVVLRDTDSVSQELVRDLAAEWGALRKVDVTRGGVVAAMNAGLSMATGTLLALTDDDAEPAPDWLERLRDAIREAPDVAGAGGRDEQAGVTNSRDDVGRLQWFGRLVGNHHIGTGPARFVDVLKGVNCAFRTSLVREIGFDERLRGAGAQVHWELALCLRLRAAGWRLVYDPAICVTHHVSARHDADQLHRGRFDEAPLADAVHNETLILTELLPPTRRLAYRMWSALVGTAVEPGLLQLPRVMRRDGVRGGLRRWRATRAGRRSGRAAAGTLRQGDWRDSLR